MKFKSSLWLGVLLIAGVRCSFAGSISSIVVYGDSLSDNGNLYALAHQPGPPYYEGRLSNGPVAVEQLAAAVGAPLVDFAFAGATTGLGNIVDGGTASTVGAFNLPGMLTEYYSSQSMMAIPAYKNGLFIVWGGPNDFSSLPSNPTKGQVAAAVNLAVSDLLTIVNGLRAQGVTNILVPGMPDLGLTPSYLSKGAVVSAEATALTNLFNETLVSELPGGTKYFDTANLLRSIVAHPGTYGFSDVSDACFTGATLCSDPNSYLFFDSDHPTTYADSILAQDFLAAVVPEPASVVLVSAALAGIVLVRRRLIKL